MQRAFSMTDRPILLAKAFYFSFFAAMAALMPFLVLYYEQLGLSGREIGVLTGIPPLVTMISASFWGGVADATRQYQRVLTATLIGAMVVVALLSVTTRFIWLVPVVIALGFFTAPVMPLVDNAVLAFLGDHSNLYGKVRLWGAIGFGVSPPIVGLMIEQTGLSLAFWGYLVIMSGCLFIAYHMPIMRLGLTKAISRPKFWLGLQTLIRNKTWRLFLLVIFISGMGSAVIHNYLFLYLNYLHAGKTLMGVALTVATVSELIVFLLAEALLKRWGTRQLLIMALIGHGVRLLAYSFIASPWLVLPIQLLHGFSFSLLWIVTVNYAHKLAPPGLGATAQGLVNSFHFGLGSAAGSLLGGFLYQQVGPFLMFRSAGIWVFLGVLLLLIADKKPMQANDHPGQG